MIRLKYSSRFFIGYFLNSKDCKECNEQETKVEQKENVKPNSKAHTSQEEKKEYNGEEYTVHYDPSLYESDYGVSMKVANNFKTVKIDIDLKTLSAAYGNSLDLGNNSFSKELNFDKKVRQIFFGQFGQAVGGEILFFLMEDGTIEYIPLYKEVAKANWKSIATENKMNSYGKLEGINDAVLLYPMEVYGEFGYYSVGAMRSDGSFYDLNDFVNN